MISVYKHKTSTKNIFVAIQRKHLPAASESSKLNAKGMTEVEFTIENRKFGHGIMTLMIDPQSVSSFSRYEPVNDVFSLSIGVFMMNQFSQDVGVVIEFDG